MKVEQENCIVHGQPNSKGIHIVFFLSNDPRGSPGLIGGITYMDLSLTFVIDIR